MCLYSPQAYFNFTDGEDIDLVNVSVNGRHAKDVFFKRFTTSFAASSGDMNVIVTLLPVIAI